MRVVWVGRWGALIGNQEGKAGPCSHQGGTLADPVMAVRASQPGVPACLPARLWTSQIPLATTGLLSLLLWDSLVQWRVS